MGAWPGRRDPDPPEVTGFDPGETVPSGRDPAAPPTGPDDPSGDGFRRTQRGWRLPADPAARAPAPADRAVGETRHPGPAHPAVGETRHPGPAHPATDETRHPGPATARTRLPGPGTGQSRSPEPDTRQTRPRNDAAAAGAGADVVRRFGPGVTAAPQWPGAPVPATAGRRRRSGWGGVLALLLLLGGVLAYLLLWHPDPLVLSGAQVAPAMPPGQACNVTVDVVGTIHTNGRAGTIRYRWLRSDGESTGTLTQAAGVGSSEVRVHLLWTLAGKGRYPASATLEISEPQPLNAAGGFTYSCR